MEGSISKMEGNTGVRFTERDKAVVLELVDEWKEIVEDKKTDYGTKTKKDDSWDAIAVVFNSSDGVTKRSAKQLRDWWKNSKARTKKEITSKRRSFRKTGGGSPSSPLSTEAAKVSSIVPSQLTSLKNAYDCDGDDEIDLFLTPPTHPPPMESQPKRKANEMDPPPKRSTFSLKLRAPSTSAAVQQSNNLADSSVLAPTTTQSEDLEDKIIKVSTSGGSKQVQKKCRNHPKEARLQLLEFEETEHLLRLETLQLENETAARLKEKADFEFDAVKKEHSLRMEIMRAQLQSLKPTPSTWTNGEQLSYNSSNYYQPTYQSL